MSQWNELEAFFRSEAINDNALGHSRRRHRPSRPCLVEAIEPRVFLSAHAVSSTLAAAHITAAPDPKGGVDVAWKPVPGASEYEVDAAPVGSADFTAAFYSLVPDYTAYVAPLTPMQFRVITTDANGNSSISNIAVATSLLDPPYLSTSNVTASQVDLTWSSSPNPPTSFEIRRNGQTVAVLGPGKFSYSDKGVTENTDYKYQIRAIRGRDHSDWAAIDVKTLPAAPIHLTATTTYSNRVDLAWNNQSPRADYIFVNRSEDGGKTWTQIATLPPTQTRYFDSYGLEPRKTYLYNLNSAVDQPEPPPQYVGGASSPALSDPSATVRVVTPAAGVAHLASHVVSTSEIDLSWTSNVKNATGFEIDRSTDGLLFTHATIMTVPGAARTFQANGLSESTHYWFRIRTLASTTASAYTEIDDSTLAAAPSNLHASVQGDQIVLSWRNNSRHDTTFTIERSTPLGGFIAIGVTSSLSFQDEFRPGELDYQFRIRANSGYNHLSTPSNIATAVGSSMLAGFPDQQFGRGGQVGEFPIIASTIATLPDSILVGGADFTGTFLLRRFTLGGSIDAAFGDDGQVSIPGLKNIIAIATESDGSIVVATTQAAGNPAIVRFLSDGSVDSSFGSQGIVALPMLSSEAAIAIDSKQRILVGGGVGGFHARPPTGVVHFALVRLTRSGTLDGTFGHGGITINNLNGGGVGITSLLVQPDGNILAANYNTVLRYRPSGGLDPGFAGGKGYLVLPFPTLSVEDGASLGLTSDGRILVYASGNLLQLTSNGQIDLTFAMNTFSGPGTIAVSSSDDITLATAFDGSVYVSEINPAGGVFGGGSSYDRNGASDIVPAFQIGGEILGVSNSRGLVWRVTPRQTPDGVFPDSDNSPAFILGEVGALAVQPDQKVLVAGGGGYEARVIRYNADGTADTIFNNGGGTVPLIDSNFDAVAVQSNGDIVAGGVGLVNEHNCFILARFLPDGSPDMSFGASGVVVTAFGDPVGQACTSIAIQPDGKILAFGSTSNPLGLARYLPSGALDATFGVGGQILIDPTRNHEQPAGMILLPDGKIILGATVGNQTSLIRLRSNGAIDTSFAVGGVAITSIQVATAIALDSENRIVIAGFVYGQAVEVARYLDSGALDTSFGTGGKFKLSSTTFSVDALVVQSDNSILIGGTGDDLSSEETGYVARLNDHGLDATFGIDGIAIVDPSDNADITALAIDSSGRILAGSQNLYRLNG